MHKSIPVAIVLLIAGKALSLPAPVEDQTQINPRDLANVNEVASTTASPVRRDAGPPVAAGRGGGYNGSEAPTSTPLAPAMAKRQFSSPPTAAGRGGGYNGVGAPTPTPVPRAIGKRQPSAEPSES